MELMGRVEKRAAGTRRRVLTRVSPRSSRLAAAAASAVGKTTWSTLGWLAIGPAWPGHAVGKRGSIGERKNRAETG